MVPVFGGISGATSTTCNAGAPSPVRDEVGGAATTQTELAGPGFLDERRELIIRRTQEAGALGAVLHPATCHVVVPDLHAAGVQHLGGPVVQVDPDILLRIRLDG